MLRQLLAALALLTGFAVAAEPARAAEIAQRIESASLAEQGPACIATHALLVGDTPPSGVLQPQGGMCPRPVLTVPVPPIQLQADRARE
jgi:hypothetical protein